MKEGRKPEYQGKTPGDELQKMPHTTLPKDSGAKRDSMAQWYWWQARKADVLTVTPREVDVGWLVKFPITYYSISETYLPRQCYVLPH